MTLKRLIVVIVVLAVLFGVLGVDVFAFAYKADYIKVSSASTFRASDIAYVNGLFIASGEDLVTYDYGLWVSTDLKTWSDNKLVGAYRVRYVIYDESTDTYLVYTDGGSPLYNTLIYRYTSDFSSGEYVGSSGSEDFDFVGYYGGVYVAFTAQQIYTATDGVNWESVWTYTPGSYDAFEELVYGNGIYMVRTANDALYASMDLITWTDVTPEYVRTVIDEDGTSRIGSRLYYTSDAFYLPVSTQYRTAGVLRSVDGDTWTWVLSDVAIDWVAGGSGKLVAAFNSPYYTSYIYVSYDNGVTWELGQLYDKSPVGAASMFAAESAVYVYYYDSGMRETAIYEVLGVEANNNTDLTISGTCLPTVVEFRVPTETGFVIIPNEGEHAFVTSYFVLENMSYAPLHVEIADFSPSLTSLHVFNDVLPSAHVDWTLLSEQESMRDLALALVVNMPSEWEEIGRTTPIYAMEVIEPISVGVIKSRGTASFGFTAKHGYSFARPVQTQYRVTFVFSVA